MEMWMQCQGVQRREFVCPVYGLSEKHRAIKCCFQNSGLNVWKKDFPVHDLKYIWKHMTVPCYK